MLKAKSLLVIFAILIAFVGTTLAKEFPGDKAGKKADYLYKKLALTNDQYTKVYQVLFDYETKVASKCHAKGHKCDDKCKTECANMQKTALGDIEKVLNKDQVTKFTPMKDKFFKMSMKKKVKKVKKDETTTETKEVKKDEKKDVKKETKKEEKKETKKEEKKDEKKK
ncbi:MAG: hypothetical protein HY959_04790 [Ignavibacteriae bacterium]|nr:hypothetical protein [Ignavibacteriota bacterium]